MSLSLTLAQSSGPSPSRSVTPGRKPSISTSALAASCSTRSRPSGDLRSAVTDRRLRSMVSLLASAPNFGGRSTRTTSAPRSPRIIAACGPGPIPASSMTRSPASGPAITASSSPACVMCILWWTTMTVIDSGIEALTPVEGLTVTLADGVLSVTIDRPDSLNSVTTGVLAGIADAMEGAARDPRVRAVRLGGAGRGFSSGAGISADDAGDDELPTQFIAEANRAIRAIVALPRPVVAVVHGPAAGVGVSLALACDLVLASDKAFFLLAFTKIGLMPDGGASALVAAAVGRIRAMRMALLAEQIGRAHV